MGQSLQTGFDMQDGEVIETRTRPPAIEESSIRASLEALERIACQYLTPEMADKLVWGLFVFTQVHKTCAETKSQWLC